MEEFGKRLIALFSSPPPYTFEQIDKLLDVTDEFSAHELNVEYNLSNRIAAILETMSHPDCLAFLTKYTQNGYDNVKLRIDVDRLIQRLLYLRVLLRDEAKALEPFRSPGEWWAPHLFMRILEQSGFDNSVAAHYDLLETLPPPRKRTRSPVPVDDIPDAKTWRKAEDGSTMFADTVVNFF